MEFKINKATRPIIRPATKTTVKKPIENIVQVESIKFVNIKICEICGTVFSNSTLLSRHSEIHVKSN